MNHYHFSTRETCRMCNSKFSAPAFTLADSPIADSFHKNAFDEPSFPLEVFNCKSCGQLQLKHIVAPEEIYNEYIYWTHTSPDLLEHFKQYAKDAIEKCLNSAGLVVDIGCNDGTLLKNFLHEGFSVFGIEPAKNIADYLKKENIPFINSYMNKESAEIIKDQHGFASIITCNNVFANVDDVDSFFEAVKLIMNEDSVFIIEANYLLSMLDKQVFDYIYHEHLSYLSVKSISALCMRHNMEIFDLQLVDTKGGSFRSYIRRKQANSPVIASIVHEQISKETEQGTNIRITYQRWMEKINKAGSILRTELVRLKKSGHTVVGYGASATVTTLVHQFNLQELIDFMVDDNQIKHDSYCPGTNIRVHSPTILVEQKKCVVAVTSWRFTDFIWAQKEKLFIENGHHVLRVYPNIEYLS